jgi:DNA-binding winged helix-turn-helix (wHTH) protein
VRLRFDLFEINEAEARLTCAGEQVVLAPKPFTVLCALARRPQTLVTKSALLDEVWGHRFVSESVLKTTISDVRSALQDDSKKPRYIETVHSRGYRFIASAVSMPSRLARVRTADADAAADQSAHAALMILCRTDAALATLIRAVAATLDGERFPSTGTDLPESPMNGSGRELLMC